jgi:anti-anti-sigma factor
MILILAAVAIVSAGISAQVSYQTASQAVEHQSFEKLTAVRQMKGRQVEDYFRSIVNQITTMAESRMIIDAMREFQVGYSAFDEDVALDSRRSQELDRALRLYYHESFLKRLDTIGGFSGVLSDYWPEARNGRLLQQMYISSNSMDTGSKHLLDAADDGSRYSAAHRRYHPLLRNFLERFGYYDIFLVDHQSGNVVYTVFKEVDFGTSLNSGPYRESNLADAYRAARDSGAPGFVRLEDFKPYVPSYGAHASFISTPIYDGQDLVGVLVFQMPVDRINDVMTSGGEWETVGLGRSGETYIVGQDLKLRNQSRFLLEDRDNYLRAIEKAGVDRATVQRIATLGSAIGLQTVDTHGARAAVSGQTGASAIGLQTVDTKGARAAVSGQTGAGLFEDYRGVTVLSAYRPLDIPDVRWVIMSEIDHAEAMAPTRAMRNQAFLVQAILIVAIIAIAFWFATSLTRPLKRLTVVAGELASGRLDDPVESKGNDEIAALSRSFERMRASLYELVQRQEREIDALAVPLIPLREDVIALPLVGELDQHRMLKVRRVLTEGLQKTGASAALLDLTGVPRLDKASAETLVGAAKAARLLGVRVALTGLRAEVATTLVELDLPIDDILMERSMESGLKAVLASNHTHSHDDQFTEEEYQ